MRCCFRLGLFVALALFECAAQTPTYGIGKSPSAEELRAWDISISPDGDELPAGSGTAAEGAVLYAQRCAGCHGKDLEGRRGVPRLAGGKGTLTTSTPVKTIGSFWPYATSIWDYINRAMPVGGEGTLTANETYALTAYLLHRNEIIGESTQMDAKSLPKVHMPNRTGFIPTRIQDLRRGRCARGPCP
jgi:S-disulfanyl-L-cysteine oxidoreductase SoxD